MINDVGIWELRNRLNRPCIDLNTAKFNIMIDLDLVDDETVHV